MMSTGQLSWKCLSSSLQYFNHLLSTEENNISKKVVHLDKVINTLKFDSEANTSNVSCHETKTNQKLIKLQIA